MARMNGLDKLSSTELKAMKARIEQMLVERESTERKDLREKMAAMAAKAGFSLDDLVGGGQGARSKGRKAGKAAKGAVLYRNPKDASQTWSGRGRMPLWLSDAIKKGQKKETFRVG